MFPTSQRCANLDIPILPALPLCSTHAAPLSNPMLNVVGIEARIIRITWSPIPLRDRSGVVTYYNLTLFRLSSTGDVSFRLPVCKDKDKKRQ